MKAGISTNHNLTDAATCLKQAGINFVLRYYSSTTSDPDKCLTRGEAEALSKVGLEIGVVYEDSPTSLSYFSRGRGYRDGVNAYHCAINLHQPPGSAIYFAVDYDADTTDIAGSISDYFLGINDGMRNAAEGKGGYIIGVYGSGATCDFLKKHCPFVSYSWLGESTAWLGSGSYLGWDVKQAVATSECCGFSSEDYEQNVAHDEFGGFVLPYVPSLIEISRETVAFDLNAPSVRNRDDDACFLLDLSVLDLNLSYNARRAADLLQSEVPNIRFTSGRRNAKEQARAMAGNIVKTRSWIRDTYRASPERDALQDWLDSHPAATSIDDIAAGLESTMIRWSDDQKSGLSLHFSGRAFDVHPIAGEEGDRVKMIISRLPNLLQFLDSEGGLIIWHAEFAA